MYIENELYLGIIYLIIIVTVLKKCITFSDKLKVNQVQDFIILDDPANFVARKNDDSRKNYDCSTPFWFNSVQ